MSICKVADPLGVNVCIVERSSDPEFEVFHFYEQKEPSKQSKGERASKSSEGAPPVTSHSTTVKPHTRTRSTTRAPPTKNTGLDIMY